MAYGQKLSGGVAIVDALGKHGGIHYYVHDQANALINQGWEVHVFSPCSGLELKARYASHHLFAGVYGPSGLSKVSRAIRLGFDLLKAIRKGRVLGCEILILHVFKSDAFELLLAAAAKVAGFRIYPIVHDVSRLDAKSRLSFLPFIVKIANVVVVHNRFSKDTLLKTVNVGRVVVEVIPHGNYIGHYPLVPSRVDARRKLGIDQAATVVLFFGNPRKEKGLDLLLNASRAFTTRTDFKLLIAGKIKAEEELRIRELARRNLLNENIQFHFGHVADEDVPFYYRAATIVVLPYHRVYESGVAVMALGFGRPVLASSLPVFQTLAEESNAVILFESGDQESLAISLRSVLDCAHDLTQLEKNAKQFAIQQRSWTKSGYLWSKLLELRADTKIQ